MNSNKSSTFSRIVFLIIGIFHILAACMFYFRPDEFFYLVNVGPKVFRAFIEIPNASERFWIAYASQYYILSGLLIIVSGYQNRNKPVLLILVLSKLICSFSLFHLFNVHEKYFAYFAGGIVEAFLLIVILVFTLKSIKN